MDIERRLRLTIDPSEMILDGVKLIKFGWREEKFPVTQGPALPREGVFLTLHFNEYRRARVEPATGLLRDDKWKS